MPTIDIVIGTLNRLARRPVAEHDLQYAKAGVESKSGTTWRIEISDTNRPDLWSVEGVARVLRGIYKKDRGCPRLPVKKASRKIFVDTHLKSVRPYIAGFAATNMRITDDDLKDLVQLQEKLAENFGKKREKISIGIYNCDGLTLPLSYTVAPPGFSFVPLDSQRPQTLREILDKHPKGKAYGSILAARSLLPIFIDAKKQVLSFPPIVNSNDLGRVVPGMRNVFVEVTGTDHKAVLLATNIVAYALHDRGATIEPVATVYPYKTTYGKIVAAPYAFGASLAVEQSLVGKVLGITVPDTELKRLLESMQYDVALGKGKLIVRIPDYRNDIMHAYDVIEDVAIAYGYAKIASQETSFFTAGAAAPLNAFRLKATTLMIGHGFQEILSPVLSNTRNLEGNMLVPAHAIEIANPMTETYSAVRSWLLPSLLSFLTKNMHVDYPQFIFEVGECAVREGGETRTETKLAACITGTGIGYQNLSPVVHSLLTLLGIDHRFEKHYHPSFLNGRTARIIADKALIGIVGEIHPAVLNSWGLEKPVVACELDVSALHALQAR